MNQLVHSAAQLLRFLLIEDDWGNVPGTKDIEWACFLRNLPDDPKFVHANALAVYDTQGVQLARMMMGDSVDRFGVALKIRSKTYSEGWALAQQIMGWADHIKKIPMTVGDCHYVVHNLSRTSSIIPIGPNPGDTTRRENFTVNFLMTVEQIDEYVDWETYISLGGLKELTAVAEELDELVDHDLPSDWPG
jgi:hypothetical protein